MILCVCVCACTHVYICVFFNQRAVFIWVFSAYSLKFSQVAFSVLRLFLYSWDIPENTTASPYTLNSAYQNHFTGKDLGNIVIQKDELMEHQVCLYVAWKIPSDTGVHASLGLNTKITTSYLTSDKLFNLSLSLSEFALIKSS